MMMMMMCVGVCTCFIAVCKQSSVIGLFPLSSGLRGFGAGQRLFISVRVCRRWQARKFYVQLWAPSHAAGGPTPHATGWPLPLLHLRKAGLVRCFCTRCMCKHRRWRQSGYYRCVVVDVAFRDPWLWWGSVYVRTFLLKVVRVLIVSKKTNLELSFHGACRGVKVLARISLQQVFDDKSSQEKGVLLVTVVDLLYKIRCVCVCVCVWCSLRGLVNEHVSLICDKINIFSQILSAATVFH